MLEGWDDELARFVKVMPHDYKRALLELTEENEIDSARGRPSRPLAAGA